MNEGTTIARSFAAAAERLAAAGIASPRLDARLIFAHALGLSPEAMIGHHAGVLTDAQAEKVERLIRRRIAREPVSHLLGQREFWSLPFAVTPDVLDPRPDSETIVEAVLEMLPNRQASVRVLDLGTGSGCLLLALLAELPCATGIGIDRSIAACRIAMANAAALDLADRASFVASHWGSALSGYFDVVVANPPYIADDVIDALAPEVALHEPRLALAGGPDGLDAYRCLALDVPRLMARDGFAVLEVDAGMHDPVARLFGQAGLALGCVRHDLGGVERGLVMMHRTRNR